MLSQENKYETTKKYDLGNFPTRLGIQNYQGALREASIRKKRKFYGALPYRGGWYPPTILFPVFPKGKIFYCFKMIYMLWNMKKKSIKFYSNYDPLPSIPFRSPSKANNLSLEEKKRKDRIHYITCRLIFWKF